MATLGTRGLLQMHEKVEGMKGNKFEATTWHEVVGIGLAVEVGAGVQLSSATTCLERGGAAFVAKMREARSIGALCAFL
jgi:hypothetical protein